MLAYRIGEGGFVVKFKKGKGFASFKGGSQAVDLVLSSVSVGAQAGGSNEWGVGVVLDLEDENDFGGVYEGTTKGATAGDESFVTTDLRRADAASKSAMHAVVLVGAATGLSANAGVAKLEITVDR